jgi:sirohydrochlorin ferrochelatase
MGEAAPCQPTVLPLPAHPLLLVVHGRAGGVIPAELAELADELAVRRGAPVAIEALTAATAAPERNWTGQPVTLVPLFLFPGAHVRVDVPAIARAWRRLGPVQMWPFLGAWPGWQRALADEVAALRRRVAAAADPLLLHHPLDGPLAARYLRHLEAVTGARCQAAAYSAATEEGVGMKGQPRRALLPLALASSRLTEGRSPSPGPPLLARAGCRQAVLELLEGLP